MWLIIFNKVYKNSLVHSIKSILTESPGQILFLWTLSTSSLLYLLAYHFDSLFWFSYPFHLLSCLFFLPHPTTLSETGSHVSRMWSHSKCVFQLLILLPLLSEFWDYRLPSPFLVYEKLRTEPRTSCMLKKHPSNWVIASSYFLFCLNNKNQQKVISTIHVIIQNAKWLLVDVTTVTWTAFYWGS